MPPTVTGTVLDGIISGVLEDLHERQLMVTSDNLREATELVAPAIDPIPRLTAPGLSVISEIKRSSPSNGQLAAIHDPAALADQYRSGGAAAISVLTEERRFQGSLADLDAVRAKVEIPVLRKDFVVAEYQVLEARAHGADLILLIVAALSDDDLQRLYDLAIELGMTPLVEVHTPEEVSRATALGARVVGVNARNLKTLEVDKTIFRELLGELPENVVKVAESGILCVDEAVEVYDLGADAVLVGEMLVRHGEPAQVLRKIHRATAVSYTHLTLPTNREV